MAKKKATKAPQAPTQKQLDLIADRIRNTGLNVYRVAEQVLGREMGEEIFELLQQQCRLFKCEYCGIWLNLDCKDPAFDDVCSACLDSIDSGGDDEFEDDND